jgi:endoglucanase
MFHSRSEGEFPEEDFRWIAELGFDFVRLPLCYLLWVEHEDPFRVREAGLEPVDRAVELGERCGLHVSLNFHRAPGYSVNRERAEPFDLWKDARALEAFCLHWATFARRYRGLSSDTLSFDLVNEPSGPAADGMTRADHERVVRAAVAAIRAEDSDRLIFADGLRWGRDPAPELADLGIAQSCRGYDPHAVSHYQARWVKGEGFPEPVWPGVEFRGEPWDRARLEAAYAPWAELARRGIGVHCGECGAYNRTPHEVFLAWFRDVLGVLTEHNIGYALWNFRGPFGLLDSGRADVVYEDWCDHKLDRALLELLRQF